MAGTCFGLLVYTGVLNYIVYTGVLNYILACFYLFILFGLLVAGE